MQARFTNKQIHQASGEQLLLMAVLGDADVRSRIDQELDGRAALRCESARLMKELSMPSRAA